MPIKTYAQAINEATDQLLASDKKVVVIGEGVPDGVFGSTAGLKQKYDAQVYDSPLSENGITGICVGAAISGLRPIMVHQRVDFALLSLDQIAHNATKTQVLFNKSCPIVIRAIIGRGWGQGQTHSNSYAGLFASIPGLKIVMPTSPSDSKGLLIAAVHDNNPCLILEHRWLYNLSEEVPDCMYETPLDKSKLLRAGEDITVVSMSYSAVESLKAVEMLKVFSIRPEVIDLISCHHIDLDTIGASVRKTGRLLVVDIGGIGSEIVRQVTERYFHQLKSAPIVLGLPDYPCPTSHFLTENYYPDEYDVANAVLKMVGSSGSIEKPAGRVHDVPDSSFRGPF